MSSTNGWTPRFDKYHPTKKKRPVVQNTMSGKIVAAEYAVLAAVGLGASLLVNIPFFVCELWLLVMGVLYNVKPFRTKDIAYLDVLSESINNAIRLLLGWFFETADYRRRSPSCWATGWAARFSWPSSAMPNTV